MNFDPTLIADAKKEMSLTPYGYKGSIKKKWKEKLGCSLGHLNNLIRDVSIKRQRQGKPQKPEYYEWAPIIFQIKKRPPEDAGEISTENAIAIAIKQGLIPPEAADVHVGTYNAIGRKNGWNKKSIRAVRFQAEKPNQAHHFDASTSKFLYIAKPIGDSDYLLKLHHRPAAAGYKNKPVPVNQLRAWRYGLVDDYSGRFIARYIAAAGEGADDSSLFLAWAWAQIGLPEQLLCDQGMLKKALRSRDMINRLGIELPEMMPYQKRGHGKIERPWRTAGEDFEKLFFAAITDSKKFRISMSELNQEFTNYIEDKYNQRRHRFERNITRMQAWSKVNLNGGIIQIPENVLSTVAHRARRKVGIDGTVQYKGVTYEVNGLYDVSVDILEGVFAERIIAHDIKTGKNHEMEIFKPLSLGEFRSHPATPHQQLVKQSESLHLTGITLYSEKVLQDEKILSMPIRTKEEREIEDPLTLPDRYTNVNEAMKDFMSYLPGVFLKPQEREVIEKEIEAHGLSKAFVENFGLEVRAQMARREAM